MKQKISYSNFFEKCPMFKSVTIWIAFWGDSECLRAVDGGRRGSGKAGIVSIWIWGKTTGAVSVVVKMYVIAQGLDQHTESTTSVAPGLVPWCHVKSFSKTFKDFLMEVHFAKLSLSSQIISRLQCMDNFFSFFSHYDLGPTLYIVQSLTLSRIALCHSCYNKNSRPHTLWNV